MASSETVRESASWNGRSSIHHRSAWNDRSSIHHRSASLLSNLHVHSGSSIESLNCCLLEAGFICYRCDLPLNPGQLLAFAAGLYANSLSETHDRLFSIQDLLAHVGLCASQVCSHCKGSGFKRCCVQKHDNGNQGRQRSRS